MTVADRINPVGGNVRNLLCDTDISGAQNSLLPLCRGRLERDFELNTETAPVGVGSTGPGPDSTPCPLRLKEVKLPMTISGPGASARNNAPTSLYLYYDKLDVLLYVGITSRGIKRNLEHNADKEWWQYVARQEVRHLPDRPAALRAERDLIIRLNPPFNKVHNPDHESLAAAYRRFVSQRRPSDVPAGQRQGDTTRPEEWENGGLVHLELYKREGKFLHCRSRSEDVALATFVDLEATRFDTFMAKGGSVGRIVSLARELYGFEMILKGSWLKGITGAAVLIEPSACDYTIQSLRLKIDQRFQAMQLMGITDSRGVNFGKFSNGAQWRTQGQSLRLARGGTR